MPCERLRPWRADVSPPAAGSLSRLTNALCRLDERESRRLSPTLSNKGSAPAYVRGRWSPAGIEALAGAAWPPNSPFHCPPDPSRRCVGLFNSSNCVTHLVHYATRNTQYALRRVGSRHIIRKDDVAIDLSQR